VWRRDNVSIVRCERVVAKVAKTVTRAHLSEYIYQQVGLSRKESADLLEMFLKEVADTLKEGETVKLSSFGSFSVRQKSQRIGRNPKTGEEVPILPRKVLVFRPSQLLKAGIRKGCMNRQPFKSSEMWVESSDDRPEPAAET